MNKQHGVIIGLGDRVFATVADKLAPDHALSRVARSDSKMRALTNERCQRNPSGCCLTSEPLGQF